MCVPRCRRCRLRLLRRILDCAQLVGIFLGRGRLHPHENGQEPVRHHRRSVIPRCLIALHGEALMFVSDGRIDLKVADICAQYTPVKPVAVTGHAAICNKYLQNTHCIVKSHALLCLTTRCFGFYIDALLALSKVSMHFSESCHQHQATAWSFRHLYRHPTATFF